VLFEPCFVGFSGARLLRPEKRAREGVRDALRHPGVGPPFALQSIVYTAPKFFVIFKIDMQALFGTITLNTAVFRAASISFQCEANMKWLRLSPVWPVFRGALFEWNQDKAPRMAGALAFYTIFSLTPIVIISVGIGGSVFGHDAALREVLRQVAFLVGPAGGEAIEMLVKNAPERQASMMAVIFGVCVMLFAATGAFAELKDSMNTIWEVQPAPGLGLKSMVWDRLISFAMVLVVSFLLLVSLVASMFLQVLVDRIAQEFALFEVGYAVLSVTMVTFLFALMYKVLPDAYVAWRDVWLGAFVAASLFVLGRTLFGLYLGHSTIGSSYGAAGSLVIVVLWTYYSALILLFGAEMTQVQARLRGESIVPKESAVRVTEHDRVQQGVPHGLPDAPPAALD